MSTSQAVPLDAPLLEGLEQLTPFRRRTVGTNSLRSFSRKVWLIKLQQTASFIQLLAYDGARPRHIAPFPSHLATDHRLLGPSAYGQPKPSHGAILGIDFHVVPRPTTSCSR